VYPSHVLVVVVVVVSSTAASVAVAVVVLPEPFVHINGGQSAQYSGEAEHTSPSSHGFGSHTSSFTHTNCLHGVVTHAMRSGTHCCSSSHGSWSQYSFASHVYCGGHGVVKHSTGWGTHSSLCSHSASRHGSATHTPCRHTCPCEHSSLQSPRCAVVVEGIAVTDAEAEARPVVLLGPWVGPPSVAAGVVVSPCVAHLHVSQPFSSVAKPFSQYKSHKTSAQSIFRHFAGVKASSMHAISVHIA